MDGYIIIRSFLAWLTQETSKGRVESGVLSRQPQVYISIIHHVIGICEGRLLLIHRKAGETVDMHMVVNVHHS